MKNVLLTILLLLHGVSFLHSQCCSNGINLLAGYNPTFDVEGDPIPPGFQTDNIYAVDLGPGLYSVITSRNWGACWQTPEFDHTTGDEDGRYLWFDTAGDASPNNPAVAWVPYDPLRPPGQENTLDVIPNTSYVFSVWIRDLARNTDCVSGGAPIMGLRINGEDMAEINLGDFTEPCCPEWIYLCSEWNSGESTEVTIQIESRTGSGFTDLGIDDVYFGTTDVTFDGILGGDITTCTEGGIVLQANLIGATLEWSDGSTADTLVVTEPGTYWVTILQGACSGSDTIVVSISEGGIEIDLGPDIVVCENEGYILSPDNIPGASYTWQDGSTGNTLAVADEGLYWLEVSSVCGDAADSVWVDISQLPDLSLGNDTVICPGESVTLYANASMEESLLWPDNSTGNTFLVDEEGTYWVEAENECGTVTDYITVENFAPSLDADWQVTSAMDFCGTSIMVNALYTGSGENTLEWNSGSGLTSSEEEFTVTYTGGGPYTLQLLATGDCDEQQMMMQLFDPGPGSGEFTLEMPNIFTPNGDGDNELFFPFGVVSDEEKEMEFSMKIYDRWGILLFESTKVTGGWNGQYNNGKCTEGVYFYIVEYHHPCNAASKSFDGSFTLLR